LAPDPASPESDKPDGLDRSRPDRGRLPKELATVGPHG